ncbi:MAG TPA: PLP-dependent aminotransferase family protein [Polyangiales bacterium]|nr:PLP-dependent aminotransferase family protein [Polyangiales bacterium]
MATGTGWEISVALEQAGGDAQPLFLRIARALIEDIRRGRLRPGSRLPGSRALARTLAVHRNTVLAAFRELLAEGWIEARHGQGTFVSEALPETTAPRRQPGRPAAGRPQQPGFDLVPHTLSPPQDRVLSPNTLYMWGGLPDLRLVPTEAFVRALRRVLRKPRSILDYGDHRGHERLRSALASMLQATRGILLGRDDLLITRGSQMGLSLAAEALLRPGDAVAVEAYGYRPAWQAFKRVGARLIPVQVDEHGLDTAALAELCERERVRAVYVTPHHQYPTTVPLSPGRRIELLELAQKHRFAILEDDYDHEFHYEGRPLLPLASADTAGVVVYIGTLSKVFAPGVRLGYVAAPAALLSELAARRFYQDRQGDQASECALAELIEDGELARHTRRMRRIYRERRDRCVELLSEQFGEQMQFRVPNGGMALWVKLARGLDPQQLLAAAETEGVSFQAGRQFAANDRPLPHARIGYACLDLPELEEAMRRLQRALRKLKR